MNYKAFLVLILLIVLGCNQQQEQESKSPIQNKPVKEEEFPVQMIKSPDGQLYFPENIHRPKSEKDSLVLVYPSKNR